MNQTCVLKPHGFTKLMRKYSNDNKHVSVEPYCWRGMKRTLVENKRIVEVEVTTHGIRFWETGHFPGPYWSTRGNCGLQSFVDWILADESNMSILKHSDSSSLNDSYGSVCSAISTCSTAVSNMNTTIGSLTDKVAELEAHIDIAGKPMYTTNTPDWSIIKPSSSGCISIYDPIPELEKRVTNIEQKIEEKENKNMNTSMFNFDFGKVSSDAIRLSMYGIAVKSVDGRYVAYDAKNHSIMDVEIMNIPCADLMYKMPVAIKDIKTGDVVIHNRVPMFVVEVHTSTLKVIDIREGTEKEIYLTKSPFGFNFATKVVSMIDMTGAKADAANPFGSMLPFLMMKDGKMDDILPYMMMSGGTMDMSNPMMMYLMMKDGKMNDMLPLMMMTQAQSQSKCNCNCHTEL